MADVRLRKATESKATRGAPKITEQMKNPFVHVRRLLADSAERLAAVHAESIRTVIGRIAVVTPQDQQHGEDCPIAEEPSEPVRDRP